MLRTRRLLASPCKQTNKQKTDPSTNKLTEDSSLPLNLPALVTSPRQYLRDLSQGSTSSCLGPEDFAWTASPWTTAQEFAWTAAQDFALYCCARLCIDLVWTAVQHFAWTLPGQPRPGVQGLDY